MAERKISKKEKKIFINKSVDNNSWNAGKNEPTDMGIKMIISTSVNLLSDYLINYPVTEKSTV